MKGGKWETGKLSTNERVTLAKSKSDDLVNRMLQVVRLHETNKIVTYSDALAKQIPLSFAAHAFNEFQNAIHLFEITRLCALWDTPGEHRVSIPTVVALIDDTDVKIAIEREIANSWSNFGSLAVFEQEQVTSISRKLSGAVRVSRNFSGSRLIKRFRNFRNVHLAHSLKGQSNAPGNPKYGEERRIVQLSLEIVHRLYLAIHNADFDFEDAERQARKNAHALWDNCTFNLS